MLACTVSKSCPFPLYGVLWITQILNFNEIKFFSYFLPGLYFCIPIQRSYQYHSKLFSKHILIFRFMFLIWCNFFFLAILTACGILVPQPESELRSLQWRHGALTVRLAGTSWAQTFSNLVFIIFIWRFQPLPFLLLFLFFSLIELCFLLPLLSVAQS